MSRKNIIPLSLFLLVALSCSIINEGEEVNSNVKIPASEPTMAVVRDSVKVEIIKGIIQSNPITILANSVVFKGNKWTLELTKEEALSLGIQETQYDAFLERVMAMNPTKEE